MSKENNYFGNRNAAKNEVNSESSIHARCLTYDKAAWVKAAKKDGIKLTEWIVKNLNSASRSN